MQRILLLFILAVVVSTFSGTASASSITFTEIPGSYSIQGANWNGNTIAVAGQNANGSPFVFENGVFTNLQTTGFTQVGATGAVGNFFLGTGLLSSNQIEGLVFSSTGSLISTYFGFGFGEAANNGEFAGINPSGQAVYGFIDSTGHATSMQTVPFQGAENGSDANGVNGTTVAGLTAVNGGSLKAFLSINGVRQTLDVGTSSVANGVDASTNLAFGVRNGVAGWWDATGAFRAIPNASGTGTITGEITALLADSSRSKTLRATCGSQTERLRRVSSITPICLDSRSVQYQQMRSSPATTARALSCLKGHSLTQWVRQGTSALRLVR